MQINRILETILILLYRKRLTAKELAERFGVSIRTIYRDIDTLSLSGIPVYSVKGKNGGIFLDEAFSLDQALFSNTQQEDVFLALNLLKSLGILETDQLLKKFESVFDLKDWIELQLPDSSSESEHTFSTIKQGILLNRRVRFIFYSEHGQTMLFDVCPLKIIFKNQSWYLLAYIPEAKKYRLFGLNSLRSVQLLAEGFHPELPTDIEPLFETFSVTLQFSKRIGYNKYDRFLHEKITTQPDSSYLITFDFTSIEELYGFLMPFGKNVKIIEPLWVKRKICSHIQAFLENNL